MFSLYILAFALVSSLVSVSAGNLELVNDDELLNLIKTEKYVVVLFSKKDCEVCDNYENELIHLREDLVDTLNAWVVKVIQSQMVRLYSPSKEPALVFFRHGVPLLYDGPINDELILHTFTDNKEPVVKELTDETFEHLTQASTGATTGDWFVMFYSTECVDCQRLQARWEAVGAKLKTRMNVARVNRATTGSSTARRFEVYDVPTFMLFRQGKMYRYSIQKYDVNSFVGFAQEWFKNMRPEPVPVPKTPFDDLITMTADYLRENPWLWKLGSITFGVGVLLSILLTIRANKAAKPEPKKKK